MPKIRSHLVIWAAYFLGIGGLKVLLEGMSPLSLDLFEWMLGGAIGFGLVWLDRLVSIYLLAPQEQLSVQLRQLFDQKKFLAGLRLLLTRRAEQERLVLRSMLFLPAWAALALFALTSTAGLFGRGVVMGIGLHILHDLWDDFLHDSVRLQRVFFWQIKRTVSEREQRWFVWIFSACFILLSLFLL